MASLVATLRRFFVFPSFGWITSLVKLSLRALGGNIEPRGKGVRSVASKISMTPESG